MLLSWNQWQVILTGLSSQPYIIFRNRTSFCTKHRFNLTVLSCCILIVMNNRNSRRKVFYSLDIFVNLGWISGTIIQFTQYNIWNKCLINTLKIVLNSLIIGKKCNNDIRIKKVSTIHGSLLSHSLQLPKPFFVNHLYLLYSKNEASFFPEHPLENF